jgi:4-aminobutyrate--pyruvate transaminase
VQEILKKHDILLVVDEVICGFGRTGKMFACETYNIKPDVLVLSKQISSSYMPLSAILINDRFYQPIADESDRIGVFGHGFTASGHPVATAVGLENLKIIQERDLVGNVARLEEQFLSRLAGLESHALVHSSRGVGLLGALEIKPWADAKPGDAAMAVAAALEQEGVIARNVAEALCFCPPMIITAEQIDEIFDAVGRALDKVAASRA